MRMTGNAIVLGMVAALLVLGAIAYLLVLAQRAEACEQRGGVYLRTWMGTHECLKAERR